MNQQQTAAGRARIAADLVAQFEALGLAVLAAQVRAQAPAATSGGPSGFVNLGA
jgi:hypothetical protein